MTNCAKCGRPLKNPKSMEHGYGPECWGKVKAGIRKERTDATANRSDYTFHINSKHGRYDGINGQNLRRNPFYGIGAGEEKDAVKAAIERSTAI